MIPSRSYLSATTFRIIFWPSVRGTARRLCIARSGSQKNVLNNWRPVRGCPPHFSMKNLEPLFSRLCAYDQRRSDFFFSALSRKIIKDDHDHAQHSSRHASNKFLDCVAHCVKRLVGPDVCPERSLGLALRFGLQPIYADIQFDSHVD